MADTCTVRYRKILKEAVIPTHAHGAAEDVGMDLFAAVEVEVPSQGWETVRTGICVEIPVGYEGQVRPRSGLARRHGLTVLNSPGTVDPGYRGELQVTLVNFGKKPYTVRVGDRIAQLIVASYAPVKWQLAESLSETSRGEDGFGSTGR